MTTPVTFADLSHHNTVMDLTTYTEHHPVVVLKATQGTGYVDPTFATRWPLARHLGLIRGAYHYADTTGSARDQAGWFTSNLAAADWSADTDIVILDVEDNDDSAAVADADEFAGQWCARMVELGWPDGLLYTGRWYANPANLTAGDVPAGWRRLWLSDYGTATDTEMVLPFGWDRSQVAARQFTSTGTTPGVTGPVDLSRIMAAWPTKGLTMAAMTGPEFSRAFLGALADTGDVGQFGNDLWLQLRRIASEGAKEQTGPLAAQLAALTTIVSTIANVVGVPHTGGTLAAVLDTLDGRVVMTPVLTDADVDRIAAAVIAALGAGVTLTVTPATGPVVPATRPATP